MHRGRARRRGRFRISGFGFSGLLRDTGHRRRHRSSQVPEEEVGISVTDCGPLCKRASSVAKSQEQKPSPTMLCGTFARVASRSSGAGRDALPRVRRCTSQRFFLLLLRTRSCAIGAEALSLSCFSIFLWTCGAGSRGSASLPVATASANQIGKLRRDASIRPRSGSKDGTIVRTSNISFLLKFVAEHL
jgi:hypothetical protein